MRKVLSFVLVLTLVLSSFSMAFAADSTSGLTDIAGNTNEDAIQVAYDLAIVTGNPDGTYLPDKAVNRAEFAALVTRALAIPDSALAGYTTTTFKDASGYGWATSYLAFCQSKGILLGDGQGNVMPGRTVSVNEAMTMALRAIGYTANSSLLVGVWPSNYVSLAQNESLYDDVATDTTVNKASAAQIIYNLLTVQKVAVNTDGTTELLWKNAKNEVIANLLNTNLNCTEHEDVILGVDFDYEDSIINITKKIGAFGTAYLNDDDELVAFTMDSTALTGKFDGSDFEVGDVKYDLGANTFTQSALFANTDYESFDDEKLTKGAITSWAALYADDGETVTLHGDVTGKRIKDIYSVVAWSVDYAGDADLADSSVQEDIDDNELLGYDFEEDDNGDIDYNSFELVGVKSLSDIEEDDVVYVYANDDKDIRRVAVGTETIEGVIDEIEMDDDDQYASTVTIDGKDYDVSALATSDAKEVDVDSEGIFYIDAFGEIYDFDGTSGKADTYGIVKSSDNLSAEDAMDRRIRLYTSDDSTKTLTVADDDDLDWVGKKVEGKLTPGALIGYSLDNTGEVDTLDVTAATYKVDSDTNAVTFQSTKVLKIGSKTYSIDSKASVFTYDYKEGTTTVDPESYDVITLDEVEKVKLTDFGDVQVIFDDKDVVGLLIHEDASDAEDDAIYGVINTRTSAKDSSGDEVYRFKGFIDGSAFSYLTDDKSNESGQPSYSNLAGKFGVYAITLDSSGAITKIEYLNDPPKKDTDSGVVLKAAVITDLNSDKTVVTVGSEAAGNLAKYTIEDDAVVYKYDESDKEFEVSKLSSLRKNYTVALYDTKGDDADGVATVVIFIED